MLLLPYVVKPKYHLMRMLLSNGEKSEARAVAREILSMKPKIASSEDSTMRQAAKIVAGQ